MKIFKYITNGLPRLISYIIFYSPLILVVGLFNNLMLTAFYSFVVIGFLIVLLLDFSLLDMLISHHFMNKPTERTLGKIDIDKFAPYQAFGISYKIDMPCVIYTDSNKESYSLWINSRNINAKNLKQGQQIELIYSIKHPLMAQLAIDWDIAQKKHVAENIAQLVLMGIFTILVNWGFVYIIDLFRDVIS